MRNRLKTMLTVQVRQGAQVHLINIKRLYRRLPADCFQQTLLVALKSL